MLHEEVRYEPPPVSTYPFKIAAKRYWLPQFESNIGSPGALTLVFLHSTSFHKETWEPTLECLFELLANQKKVVVREAWAIDCPNHGVAAVLNQALLQDPKYSNQFTCEKYACAAHAFLTSGPVDFRHRNLVGIGHSLGGVAMTILQCKQPAVRFSSVILVEPMLSPHGMDHLAELRRSLVQSARRRQFLWESRDSAIRSFERSRERAASRGRRAWHPKVVQLYIEYGLRPCRDGYTLSCTREEEIAMYEDKDGSTKPVKCLDEACRRLPIHLMLGEFPDYIPKAVQDALSSGRTFASRRTILGAGHLVPQEVPEELAKHLFETLITYPPDPRHIQSRL
ncbi:alpha/beta-hydrolase [Gloeophyllum trabeum ATCC 11539]|uniref:Alpha/beta-hydrolase n=1 Tax=Gloeophyllum trabeum (strain ATCC 11539 / FP-39264 / Madison 617) TaxID=670483 RepID=S7RXX6_GLOTA|nr:alpha/beta-hydrolase [Gloeophyllum trabeum ATCC 11539]EPQ59795.1 alpha/beta-hydrolase [Gloeophyllum trabeum ATCC 11539]